MRWIPPGRFTIGSPGDEPGHAKAEGSQTEVALPEGFWLFDTPCTQALWQAVMGDNPSRFRTPDRPVETVSFNDVLIFLRRVNARLPGLGLSLPSEAHWEYACRAGTTTATYAGPMAIHGENNAPVLDTIAWYGGNSGVGFELANGQDSRSWPGKQHRHDKAGTHPVAQKAPNAWGLYDMLGNVWEWCADQWHERHVGVPQDGSVRDKGRAGAAVVRGGSWSDDARSVRAASRDADFQELSRDNLGFRCARVQAAGRNPRSEVRYHGSWQQLRRQQIITAVRQRLGTPLVRVQPACYGSDGDTHRIVCLISKRHVGRRGVYWYGFKFKQYDFLRRSAHAYLALGAEDLGFAFVIPVEVVADIREHLYTTPTGDTAEYWHVDIIEPTAGRFALLVPKADPLALDNYRMLVE